MSVFRSFVWVVIQKDVFPSLVMAYGMDVLSAIRHLRPKDVAGVY